MELPANRGATHGSFHTTINILEGLRDPAVRAAAGWLMRAPFLRRRGGRTTLEVLRGITSNDELIGLLTGQWGDSRLTVTVK